MLSESCKKIKAFIMIVMLSVAESRRIHANIHAHSSEKAPQDSGDAMEWTENLAQRLSVNDKLSTEEVLTEGMNAMISDPDFKKHAIVFAEQVELMKANPYLMRQSTEIAEEMDEMLAEPDSEALKKQVAERMEALMADARFQEHAERLAEEMEVSIRNDPTFKELEEELSIQMETTMKSQHARSDSIAKNLFEEGADPNFQQQAARVSKAVESLMVDPTLERKALFLAEEIETAKADDPEMTTRIAKQVDDIMADPSIRAQAKLVVDEMMAAEELVEPEDTKVTATSFLELDESSESSIQQEFVPRTGANPAMAFRPALPLTHAKSDTVQSAKLSSGSTLAVPAIESKRFSMVSMAEKSLDALSDVKKSEKARRSMVSMAEKKLPVDVPLFLCVAMWYLGNYYYNIFNKVALTAAGGVAGFPFTIATFQMGIGVLYSIFLWLAPDARKKPDITFDDWVKSLPLGFVSAGAMAATTYSLSAGSVSFANIVKAAEPAFAAILAQFVYGSTISTAKWLSLVPVIGGVVLASLGETNFAVGALVSASLANLFAALRSNENKKLMTTPGLKERMGTVGNQYAISTINSFVFLLPLMMVTEGKKLGSFLEFAKTSPVFLKQSIASGLLFYLYNELSTITIAKTNAVTQSVLNTAKRVIVICVVGAVLGETLGFLKLLGSGIGIGGVFLYSIIDNLVKKNA
jgi:solute carrier family 35 protein E1